MIADNYLQLRTGLKLRSRTAQIEPDMRRDSRRSIRSTAC
jgi:hypothetical protein